MTKQNEPARKNTLIRTILKQDPDKAVVEQLGKILSGHPDLKIPLRDLSGAAARLKVELRRSFGKELERFYEKFLINCLKHKILSAEDWKALQQLKVLFGFSDASVERIHNKVIVRHYSKTVDEVLSDKKVHIHERTFLRFIQQKLNLPPAVAKQIYRDRAAELMKRTMAKVVLDKRLSPKEEKEIEELAQHLGVRMEVDENTRDILERYRLYWMIEKGEIPYIEVSIPLQRNENCYFMADANWCEVRSVTRTARYGKTKRSVEDQVARRTFHEFTPVDSGRIFLTNKRLLFFGNLREHTIPFARIKDFVPMEHGVQIHRKSGSNPFLQFDLGVEVFSLILARNLREQAN